MHEYKHIIKVLRTIFLRSVWYRDSSVYEWCRPESFWCPSLIPCSSVSRRSVSVACHCNDSPEPKQMSPLCNTCDRLEPTKQILQAYTVLRVLENSRSHWCGTARDVRNAEGSLDSWTSSIQSNISMLGHKLLSLLCEQLQLDSSMAQIGVKKLPSTNWKWHSTKLTNKYVSFMGKTDHRPNALILFIQLECPVQCCCHCNQS